MHTNRISYHIIFKVALLRATYANCKFIVAIFYPFSQFCEIDIFLPSLQKQPNTDPNLCQRGVEYGKYVMLLLCMYY